MCCIMPWWLVLLIFGGAFIYNFFLSDVSLFRITKNPSKPMKNLERVKKEIEQQKKTEPKKNKQKTQDNTKNVKIGAATVLGGAALAHQMRKHNKHNDAAQYYDYEREVYEEEQAAYDDYIASLDMADD